MASYNKFNQFVEDVYHKQHDLSSDQLEVVLTNVAPVATNSVLTDLTEVDYTYCSSRNLTTSSSGQTSGTYKIVIDDLTLTASGGAVGPFRYVVINNSVNDKLIGWYDKGESITLSDGESIDLDFDGTNGLFDAA